MDTAPVSCQDGKMRHRGQVAGLAYGAGVDEYGLFSCCASGGNPPHSRLRKNVGNGNGRKIRNRRRRKQ